MTDGVNRALWIVIGVILAGLGGFGILANQGKLPFVDRGEPLLWRGLVELWRRGDPWNVVIPVAGGLLLAVLGVVLLRKELHRRGAPRLSDVSQQADDGQTVVRANGLVHGLENDLARASSIVKASASLTGDQDRPQVWLRINLAAGAGVAEVREHATECLERFKTTTGLDPAKVDITVYPSARRQARVR